MEISPKTIHDWRSRGVLVDEIKAAFYKIPEGCRGGYFPWFLENQHIVALAGKPLTAKEMRDKGNIMVVRTWKFIGGDKSSPDAIRAAIARKPVEEQECHLLYNLLLSRCSPSPEFDIWNNFGFAACTSEAEEGVLAGYYQQLITMCTFTEFCDAYRNRGLLDLFHSKGLQVRKNAQLEDLLSGPHPVGWRKSAWTLKQFVLQEGAGGREPDMAPSITVDYGFINCKNASERRQLRKAYKDFFINHHGDPLVLHEVAIKGNLYGFLSGIVPGVQGPKFQRLLKNIYRLPNLDTSERPWFVAEQASSPVLNTLTVLGVGLVVFFLYSIFF